MNPAADRAKCRMYMCRAFLSLEIEDIRRRLTQCFSSTFRKPIVYGLTLTQYGERQPMNTIVPVFRCANDRSHVIRKRDEKPGQPGHFFALCSECRTTTKQQEINPAEDPNMGDEQLGALVEYSTLAEDAGCLERRKGGIGIPRLVPVYKDEVSQSATREVRKNIRSRLPSLNETHSRSTTPSYEPPPSTQLFLPLTLMSPIAQHQDEPGDYDDESTLMSADNGFGKPPTRLGRTGRAQSGHFAQPTAAYLSRIGRTPSARIISSTSPTSEALPAVGKGDKKTTQSTRTSGVKLPTRTSDRQTRRSDLVSTKRSAPSLGKGGPMEPQRRDSGHYHGEGKASKRRLLVFSRTNLEADHSHCVPLSERTQ